jgi:hypothetical protein
MIRRDFLKSLGLAFASAVEISSISIPAGKILTAESKQLSLPQPALKSVRVQNRFDENGRTRRTVTIHIIAPQKLGGPEVALWCRGEIVPQLKPPAGFRIESVAYTIDQTATELRGTIEMLEILSAV